MLRRAAEAGGRDALAAFGLSQPSLGSVGIKAPTSAPGLPSVKPPSIPKTPSVPSGQSGLGVQAAKMAYAVGMGASQSSNGAGAARGEPADEGRRQRSAIDRAFQSHEDRGATSASPDPGVIAP